MRGLGLRVALLFCPQFRSSRAVFCREMAGLAASVWLFWQSLTLIADALWISDETIIFLSRYAVPLIVNLMLIFLVAACARRLHDIGLAGAWAIWALMPGLNVLLVGFARCWPGRRGPTGWRPVQEMFLERKE